MNYNSSKKYMNKHISHFPMSDLAYPYCFDEAMASIDETDFDNLSLTDIFKLYPVVNYKSDFDYLNDKGKNEYLKRKDKIDFLIKTLNKYFVSLDDAAFGKDIEELHSVDSLLVWNYFEAFDKYLKKPLVSCDAFLSILKKEYIPLYAVLENEKICKTYGKPIKDYMAESPSSITCFVSEYDEKHSHGHKRYYIPIKLFSDEEIEKMIESYINDDFANLNIVNCLMNHKNGEGNYDISAAMRLKIQKVYKTLQDKLFSIGNVMSEDYEIRIDPNQEEPSTYRVEKNVRIISYSGKWINDNINSKPTILNNLIYIFELVDLNFRFSYLPHFNSGCGLTDAFDNRQKDEYGDFTFKSLDGLGNTTFHAYYQYLQNKAVHLETVYEWFANEYIKEEFGIDGFELTLPVEGNLGLKCKNIFSEIDKLLKSYMILQKYGSIEPAMFLLERPSKYQDLKSLTGQKYIYLSENSVARRVCHLLFSDQSMLNYVNRNKEAKNFAMLIKTHDLNINEYKEFSKNNLLFLKDNEIIDISSDGAISIKDYALAKILEELYFRGFVDINHLQPLYHKALKNLNDNGWIVYDDSLFSKQEADYLNYYLNNSVFTNALGLRNIYEHTGKLGADENELYSDYLKGMKVFALVAIKINDELCMKYPEKN